MIKRLSVNLITNLGFLFLLFCRSFHLCKFSVLSGKCGGSHLKVHEITYLWYTCVLANAFVRCTSSFVDHVSIRFKRLQIYFSTSLPLLLYTQASLSKLARLIQWSCWLECLFPWVKFWHFLVLKKNFWMHPRVAIKRSVHLSFGP